MCAYVQMQHICRDGGELPLLKLYNSRQLLRTFYEYWRVQWPFQDRAPKHACSSHAHHTHKHTMHLWLQADVRWAHSGASIRIPPDRRCDLISIHRSKHSPFHLSPAFTLSAGHKTIAPARHRMAHVQRRPGLADAQSLAN